MRKTPLSIHMEMSRLIELGREAYNYPQSNDELAIQYLKEAIALYESTSPSFRSRLIPETKALYKNALNTLGNIYFERGDSEGMLCFHKFYDGAIG